MSYKIVLDEGFERELERKRRAFGDYDPVVFFWDIVKKESFDTIEYAKDFITQKISSNYRNKIKINKESVLLEDDSRGKNGK